MWVLMMGIGIRFSLGVSLFFNLVETPWSFKLSVFQGLCRGPVPLAVRGTAAPLCRSSEASLRSSRASYCMHLATTTLVPQHETTACEC